MVKQIGSTLERTLQRQKILDGILQKFELEQKIPSDKELLKELKNSSHHISNRTLTRDKADLAINNTFVTDLASKTYSKIMQDCYESVKFAEKTCRDILDKKWTRSKTIITTDEDGKTTSTIVTTEELAEPYIKASEEIRKCGETIQKMINGGSIMVSAKLWSTQRVKDKKEIEDLKTRLGELIAQKH